METQEGTATAMQQRYTSQSDSDTQAQAAQLHYCPLWLVRLQFSLRCMRTFQQFTVHPGKIQHSTLIPFHVGTESNYSESLESTAASTSMLRDYHGRINMVVQKHHNVSFWIVSLNDVGFPSLFVIVATGGSHGTLGLTPQVTGGRWQNSSLRPPPFHPKPAWPCTLRCLEV